MSTAQGAEAGTEAACACRGLMRVIGNSGAHRVGMGRACGATRVWAACGRRRKLTAFRRDLTAFRRDAVIKVMAKATEKVSWSLVWGVDLGEQERV